MGGKSKKKSTVGYQYYTNMHFAICHGEIDALRSIWWADKVYWQGNLAKTSDGSTTLEYKDNSGMFGGESSEGGAEGMFEFGAGSYEQNLIGVLPNGQYNPAAVLSIYGGQPGNQQVRTAKVPDKAVNYRGLAVVLLHDNYVGNNAYIKDISFEVERYWKGWQPGLSRIGDNMNPAHILYECLTNEDWGLGYGAERIDQAAFLKAAQTLYNEQFGLSFVWTSEQELMAFFDQVKATIDASFYLDRRTGLWTLRLIRGGDPVVMTLDPTNSVLESFSRKVMGETFNELSVKWTNPDNEEYETITVQDPANIEAQGRVIQTDKEYVGVRTAALAIKIAERDLRVASAQLATAEVTINREGWSLVPGQNVRLNWPPLGLTGLTMRVVETTQAEPGSDSIRVQLAEDVFGLGGGAFAGVPDSGWQDPSEPPKLFPYTRGWEIPFSYVIRNADLAGDQLPQLAGYSTTLAAGGASAMPQIRLWSWVTTENGLAWTLMKVGSSTPYAQLQSAMPAALTSTFSVNPATAWHVGDAQANSFVVIGDATAEEVMQVTDVATNGAITVRRGLMDTSPRSWPAGTPMYFIGVDLFTEDASQRSLGEVSRYKPSMQTNSGYMEIEGVPEVAITLRGRYELPYPPANILIGGSYWPVTLKPTGSSFTLSWATRNRLLQDSPDQISWDAASIVPETGTTYGYQLLDENGAVVKSATGLTGTSATVSISGLTTGIHTLVVWSERDGRRNFLDFSHTFSLITPLTYSGYGNSYGLGYGL